MAARKKGNSPAKDFNEAITEKDITRPEHYKKGSIMPVEYSVSNDLDALESNVVKYVTRYKHKNGLEDLLKCREYLDWIIEREENGEIDWSK